MCLNATPCIKRFLLLPSSPSQTFPPSDPAEPVSGTSCGNTVLTLSPVREPGTWPAPRPELHRVHLGAWRTTTVRACPFTRPRIDALLPWSPHHPCSVDNGSGRKMSDFGCVGGRIITAWFLPHKESPWHLGEGRWVTSLHPMLHLPETPRLSTRNEKRNQYRSVRRLLLKAGQGLVLPVDSDSPGAVGGLSSALSPAHLLPFRWEASLSFCSLGSPQGPTGQATLEEKELS